MKIPLAKPYLGEAEAQAAYDTILSGWVTQGPKVEEFERKFAEYTGAKYAVAVSSCTAALHLSLLVAGIKEGDEVICPSLSFIATANAIVQAGAVPVFADVDPLTLNLDPARAEAQITAKTKAILIVHQLGMPADIDAFKKICENHKLKLIEDAACAAGSSYKGKKIGSHSDLVCFSFHPRKVITTGDGGMITTGNEEYYNQLKLLRQHGMSVNDRERHLSGKVIFEEYLLKGYNYRMTDIQAAVGIKQLEKLDEMVEGRRKVAENYTRAFKDVPFLQLQEESLDVISNFQSYSLYIKPQFNALKRDDIIAKLFHLGVSARRGVMSVHKEIAYKNDKLYNELLQSEEISGRSFLIPIYYPMNVREIEFVVSSLKEIFSS